MTKDQDLPPLGPKAPGTPRWVKVSLAVSLALNLAIAGLVIGAIFGNHGGHPSPYGTQPPEARIMRELGLGPFLAAFEQEDRRKMARLMRQRIGGFRVNREVLATELNNILEAVKAVPFDPAQLEALMTQQTQRITLRADAGRSVILETIGQMSDAERATFAANMHRAMQRALQRAQERTPDRP